MAKYTPAQAEAQARYNEKNLKNILFQLRLGDDAEIIDAIEEAKQHGITKREWLSELFYAKPSLPEDMVSIEDVGKLLISFQVDNWQTIIEELKKRG